MTSLTRVVSGATPLQGLSLMFSTLRAKIADQSVDSNEE
jgi:hypothetical protein